MPRFDHHVAVVELDLPDMGRLDHARRSPARQAISARCAAARPTHLFLQYFQHDNGIEGRADAAVLH